MMSWTIYLRGVVAIILLILLSVSASMAQSVQLLGDYKDWSAYSSAQSSQKLCFVISKAKNVNPKPEGFTQSYLYLSHRPDENIKNEFNFIAGHEFAPESEAKLIIGGQTYDLFTKGDAAWLSDIAQTNNVAGQMRAGSILTIEGITKDNTKITHTFSLSGVTAASRAIDRECN